MSEACVVLTTCGSENEAALISEKLVEEKLAACVNIIPNIRSVYSWKGALEKSQELLLLIKTKKELYYHLEKQIKECHSYSCPEVLSLDIREVSNSYLAWLLENTR